MGNIKYRRDLLQYSGFLEKDPKDRRCRNEQLYPFNSCLMNICNESGPMLRVKKIIAINNYALSLWFPFQFIAHPGKTVQLSIRGRVNMGEPGADENPCVLALCCR